MNILISGSSGLIGSALKTVLSASGHKVYGLIRNAKSDEPFHWNPDKNSIQLDASIALDVVINLAGENIADSRWSQKKKAAIFNSRVKGTRLLAETVAELKNKPALFISGSAIGYYGDTGDNIVDEDSSRGTGFLSDIAVQWEAATQAVEDAGIRTIHMRTGIVLSTKGGVLQKMLLPFKMGLGGIVGNGEQYLSWISIDDMTHIIDTMINDDQLSGRYNLVAPQPVTNRRFTKALGHALHRPTVLPLPAFMVRLLFGEMGDALLLSSSRVFSTRLASIGYTFIDNTLEQALTRLLQKH